MKELLTSIYDLLMNTLDNLGAFAPIFACLLIMVESILPFLPLCVFITINFLAFGNIIGFLISWICTVIGCMFSFFIFKYFSNKIKPSFYEKHPNINKVKEKISKLSLTQITIVLVIPFTPAFTINIAAGLTNMSAKKYLIACLIGKIFLVYFWGFIGTSLIDSLKHPIILVEIGIFIVVAYIISKLLTKHLKLN